MIFFVCPPLLLTYSAMLGKDHWLLYPVKLYQEKERKFFYAKITNQTSLFLDAQPVKVGQLFFFKSKGKPYGHKHSTSNSRKRGACLTWRQQRFCESRYEYFTGMLLSFFPTPSSHSDDTATHPPDERIRYSSSHSNLR